ncbi:MAG: molybdopterin molybdotransferase MoeA [Gemmatimonadota bacterium]
MRDGSRDADWIGLQAALAEILAAVAPTDAEQVPLEHALGRVLAEDAVSPIDLPLWNNSAMDGFAVRSDDIAGATRDAPIRLKLIESVPAGAFAARAVGGGEAIKIMTGAPVPDGADSVVRSEHTQENGEHVVVFSAGDARRNIRPRGEDVTAGGVAVAAATSLRAGEIGLLASIGCARVRVHRRPVIAILSTGDELVDVTAFDEVLAGRRIVNSNSYALAAAVRATGAEPVLLGIARDERADLHAQLTRGLQADVLVTSAGASVGEHDLVKDVLEELGVRTRFWRVRIRPGSPFSFGSSDHVPVFGLPGNPVSAVVTFEILVKPALRKMLGRRALHSPVVTARLGERVATGTGLTQFLRVRLTLEAGILVARTTGPQGSGILSSVAHAHGLMVVPEDVGEIAAGTDVKVVRLLTSDDAQLEPGYETRMTT